MDEVMQQYVMFIILKPNHWNKKNCIFFFSSDILVKKIHCFSQLQINKMVGLFKNCIIQGEKGKPTLIGHCLYCHMNSNMTVGLLLSAQLSPGLWIFFSSNIPTAGCMERPMGVNWGGSCPDWYPVLLHGLQCQEHHPGINWSAVTVWPQDH